MIAAEPNRGGNGEQQPEQRVGIEDALHASPVTGANGAPQVTPFAGARVIVRGAFARVSLSCASQWEAAGRAPRA
jgi:hypothetical protein